MLPTRKLVAGTAAIGLLSASRAGAQNMSADRIIRSLRPTAPSSVGRGIRPVGPAVDAPSVDLTVQFAASSGKLMPAAARILDELGRALSGSAVAEYRFRIEGHTDTAGMGQEHLVKPTGPGVAQARNRRVTVVDLGA